MRNVIDSDDISMLNIAHDLFDPKAAFSAMFTASAVSVANIYYCQPLLSEMGHSLGVSDRAIGYLPMWTQAGTALDRSDQL